MKAPRWWLHTSALALAVSLVLPRALPAAACVGDCDGKGRVDIHDLVLGVNIALGARPVSACQALANTEGAVDVAQLVQAVHNALGGCAGVRFVDNGDGTITDHETGLTWEKKVAMGAGMDFTNLHAADNKYVLAGQCPLGDWCQPSEAAAAACREGAQPHHVLCSTECPEIFNLPTDCDTGRVPGIADRPTATIWDWLAQLNATQFAGHSDWRIPSVQELTTLVDYAVFDPAVDRIFEGRNCGLECTDVNSATCSCTQSCRTTSYPTYWTASNNTLSPDEEHWYVNMCVGAIGYIPPSGANWRYVRAVRGRLAIPNPRFVDSGDGTITDRYTGLMWQKNVAVQLEPSASSHRSGPDPAYRIFAWAGQCTLVPDRLCQPNAAAAEACARGVENEPIGCTTCGAEEGTCDVDPWRLGTHTTIWDWLNRLNAAHVAGYSDWRVPTAAELESLLDYSRRAPALDPTFNEKNCGAMCTDATLPSCRCTAFGNWSATSVPDYASLGWMVTFEEGEVYNGDKYYQADFRAVRGARP